MSLRLFIAIPLPEEITARLLTLEADVPGASWRLPEHFHLTLRFLGEIDEALAREVDHELGRIVAAPFEIALADLAQLLCIQFAQGLLARTAQVQAACHPRLSARDAGR